MQEEDLLIENMLIFHLYELKVNINDVIYNRIFCFLYVKIKNI